MTLREIGCYIDVEHLNNEAKEQIEKLLTEYLVNKGILFDNKWIRFWSKDNIQLDGDFSLTELSLLVKIMEAIKE